MPSDKSECSKRQDPLLPMSPSILQLIAAAVAGSLLSVLAQFPDLVQSAQAISSSPALFLRAITYASLVALAPVIPLAATLVATRHSALAAQHNEHLAWASFGLHPLRLLRPYLLFATLATGLVLIASLQASPLALGNLIDLVATPANASITSSSSRLDPESWAACQRPNHDCLMIRAKEDGRMMLVATDSFNNKTMLNGTAVMQGRTPGVLNFFKFSELYLPQHDLPRPPLPLAALPACPSPPSTSELASRFTTAMATPLLILMGVFVGFRFGPRIPALPLGLATCALVRVSFMLFDSLVAQTMLPVTAAAILAPCLWRPSSRS